MIQLTLITSLLLAVPQAGTQSVSVERFTLKNGLSVCFMPHPDAGTVAILTLYDIGDKYDPEGQSGLSHLTEHLYVTSAADEFPARTAESWVQGHPFGSNAQTGIDYTVFATVFDGRNLATELAEAAARMGSLQISPEILTRELGRIEEELANMYGEFPNLMVFNNARNSVIPLAEGQRRGGTIEQLRDISRDHVADWHQRYYKPRNAQVILVGGFNPTVVRAEIERLFGGIPSGDALPPLRAAGETNMGGVQKFSTPAPNFARWPKTLAGLGFKIPRPDDELYAPFLLLLARMQQNLRLDISRVEFEMHDGVQGLPPIQYMPLDEPDFVLLGAYQEAAPHDAILDDLRRWIEEAATFAPGERPDVRSLSSGYEQLLGLTRISPRLLMMAPYLVGFSEGRREQLGVDALRLRERLYKVRSDDIQRCVEEIFGKDREAAVIVEVN